jgi:hypothetical protein
MQTPDERPAGASARTPRLPLMWPGGHGSHRRSLIPGAPVPERNDVSRTNRERIFRSRFDPDSSGAHDTIPLTESCSGTLRQREKWRCDGRSPEHTGREGRSFGRHAPGVRKPVSSPYRRKGNCPARAARGNVARAGRLCEGVTCLAWLLLETGRKSLVSPGHAHRHDRRREPMAFAPVCMPLSPMRGRTQCGRSDLGLYFDHVACLFRLQNGAGESRRHISRLRAPDKFT